MLGAADNLRGSVLGAVDTVAKTNDGKYDNMANKGRSDYYEGMSRMKGAPAPASDAGPTQHFAPTPQKYPGHHRDDAIANDPEAIAVGQQSGTRMGEYGASAGAQNTYRESDRV
jgi:hypothetical protein